MYKLYNYIILSWYDVGHCCLVIVILDAGHAWPRLLLLLLHGQVLQLLLFADYFIAIGDCWLFHEVELVRASGRLCGDRISVSPMMRVHTQCVICKACSTIIRYFYHIIVFIVLYRRADMLTKFKLISWNISPVLKVHYMIQKLWLQYYN